MYAKESVRAMYENKLENRRCVYAFSVNIVSIDLFKKSLRSVKSAFGNRCITASRALFFVTVNKSWLAR